MLGSDSKIVPVAGHLNLRGASSPVYLLGISGPASAGKTTLAHLLSAVFNPHIKCILHGDDFCKDLKLIPQRNGYIDADGPDGVDFIAMGKTLDFVKSHASELPDTHKSWQYDVYPDQETRALNMVSREVLDTWVTYASKKLGEMNFSIVIIEGFLLYNVKNIRERLDCRLFIRLDHSEAKHRRMTRPLYGRAAKEGEFWKTEDYFEKIVWPNYIEQHADLFDTQGNVSSQVCREYGIHMQDKVNVDIESSLGWATKEIVAFLLSEKLHLEDCAGACAY